MSRIVTTMDCETRRVRRGWRGMVGVAAAAGVVLFALGLPAQAQNQPEVTPQDIEQLKEVQKNADLIGSWDQQYVVIDQATNNVFQQQGWTSEPDQYAQTLMRDVGRIPPWKPQERQEAFMNALQARYNLSPDQRSNMNSEIQRETLLVTAKHFKEILPVAMEVVKTRAANEPFTPEQVQRWSTAIKPIMADALDSMQRVTGNLKKTMTPEQQQLLDADVSALVKRHHDVTEMVKRWEQGGWNPTDWGLQDDPIHLAAMDAYRRSNAAKDALVAAANEKKIAIDNINPTDDSAWDRYVKLFCDKYGCTDVQRTAAQAILKGSKQEAISIRDARRDQIAKCEQLIQKSAGSPEQLKIQQEELKRLLAPIGDIFNRMKNRLWEQVLTTEQRKLGPPEGQPQRPAAPATPPTPPPAQPQPPPSQPPPALPASAGPPQQQSAAQPPPPASPPPPAQTQPQPATTQKSSPEPA